METRLAPSCSPWTFRHYLVCSAGLLCLYLLLVPPGCKCLMAFNSVYGDTTRLTKLSVVLASGTTALTLPFQLQEMMGLQELGSLFYKPINDGNGSIVLAIVNQLTDAKQVNSVSSALKWQSQNKLTKNSQPSDPLLPLLNVSIVWIIHPCSNRLDHWETWAIGSHMPVDWLANCKSTSLTSAIRPTYNIMFFLRLVFEITDQI